MPRHREDSSSARGTAGVALQDALQTGSRVARRVTLSVSLRISRQAPVRVGVAVALLVPPQFIMESAFLLAPEIGHGIAGKTGFRVPPRTALGTVPGTVPALVRGVSISALL